jgi:hypothetical protein
MPVGHGLFYPAAVEIGELKVYAPPGTSWFSNLFIKGIESRNNLPVKVDRLVRKKFKKVIVLNCLDHLYGHSLSKLFNASRYFTAQFRKRNIGVVVIVPKNLAHLVPKQVDEVWIVNSSLKESIAWSEDFDQKFHAWVDTKKAVYLSPVYPAVPDYNSFKLEHYLPEKSNKSVPYSHPIVAFIYRSDRLWGRNTSHQKRNIESLWQILRQKFPEMTFILTGGFKDKENFHKDIVDLRFVKPTLRDEKNFLRLLPKVDFVIGVHGSSMLLPSALAQGVINLLPEKRYGNFAQDYLISQRTLGVYENIYRFTTIYGNQDLTDVSPEKIANIIVDQKKNREWRYEELRLNRCLDITDPWEIPSIWRKMNTEQ